MMVVVCVCRMGEELCVGVWKGWGDKRDMLSAMIIYIMDFFDPVHLFIIINLNAFGNGVPFMFFLH